MTDPLFDLFVNQRHAKTFWDILKTRYGANDAGRKKYMVGKWLQFQMVDGKSMMDQVHEYKNLVASVLSMMDGKFMVVNVLSMMANHLFFNCQNNTI